jgi:hypothetical protein
VEEGHPFCCPDLETMWEKTERANSRVA